MAPQQQPLLLDSRADAWHVKSSLQGPDISAALSWWPASTAPPPAPVTPRRARGTPWCWAPSGPAFQPGRASCRHRLASSSRNSPTPASGAASAVRGHGSPGCPQAPCSP